MMIGLLYNEQDFYITPCLSFWNDEFMAIEFSWLKWTLSCKIKDKKIS